MAKGDGKTWPDLDVRGHARRAHALRRRYLAHCMRSLARSGRVFASALAIRLVGRRRCPVDVDKDGVTVRHANIGRL